MARKRQQVQLTPEEEKELKILFNSGKVEKRYHTRSHILLLLSEGKSYDQVMEEAKVSRVVVSKWKKRFLLQGIAGIKDKKGRGRKPQYQEIDEARVIEKACSTPSGGYTNWSQKRIAEETGISQSTVCRILQKQELKPHKTEYWCGKSPDPDFEKKMLEIVGLYMNPPENALVISVDEKTQIQALDRSQPELPLIKGKPKRQTVTYKRNGTVSLIAALAVHKGEITANKIERNTAENFLKFLKKLDRKYRNKKLHIILDNFSAHKHASVKEWLSHKRKITVHYTPTYSSWLNQIEIFFNILTKDVLKGGIWHSKQQLVKQLMDYIETYNKERAKPFNWTYNGKLK